MFIKMFIGLEGIVQELSETFDKEKENIKKSQSDLRNTINERKNTLLINNRLVDTEEYINNLEDKIIESSKANIKMKKRIF